ncbi:unnamed protein product, partial [Sphenostylis stenocarpa]
LGILGKVDASDNLVKWEHKSFYQEKKQERNEFPPRQHQFTGRKIQGGGGDGARNQFLKDSSHDSCSGSVGKGVDKNMNKVEETRRRPRLNWGEGLAKLQKNKSENDSVSAASSAATPTSVGYSSLSGTRAPGGGDESGSGSYGRNTRASRDPRPQFWENVKKRHFDDVPTPPSHAHSMNILKGINYGEQHNDDHNKNYEKESFMMLNPVKKWNRAERFYSGGNGKGKEKNANVAGGANEIEEARKRPRLNWGDGLAKFEKEKTEAEGVSATLAVVAAPPLVACSSFAGVADILRVKTATGENNGGDILSASIVEFLESADLSSSLGRSNAMTKVLIWKTVVSTALEQIQTEIVSLENELKTVQSESEPGRSPEALHVVPSNDGNTEKRPLSPNLHESAEDTLCKTIISCNRETVERSCAVFDNFWPTKCRKIMCSSSLSHENAVMKEKLAEKQWFGRFKEKVLMTKYKALDHLWKKDTLLRSLRKNPPPSHSYFESSLRTIGSGCHRNRSSTSHRFHFPGKIGNVDLLFSKEEFRKCICDDLLAFIRLTLGNKLSLVPTSEMINFTSQLLSKSQNEVKRSILKTPSLILDEKDKMASMFKSSNGVVEDPLAVEKERAMINPWTSEERNTFLEKFAVFGKDFGKIASFLDHKTTADCVEFYYKSHKPDCFEKDKKRRSGTSETLCAATTVDKSENLGVAKTGGKSKKLCAAKTGLRASGRKRNLKVKVDSKKKSSEAPLKKRGISCNRRTASGRLYLWRRDDITNLSTGDDSIAHRSNSNSLGIVPDEKESVAADVLVGLCDSLPSEATSSFMTKSIDPVEASRDRPCLNVSPQCHQSVTPNVTREIDDECSSHKRCDKMDLSEWINEEKEAFFKTVSSFGDEFKMTAQSGTRSTDQCKRFFIKGQKCPRLALMHNKLEYVGSPVNEVNSARDEVNVVDGNSDVGNEKSELDTSKNEDRRHLNFEESQPVKDGNVSKPTEIGSLVSNEYIIMQNIMEVSNEVTKFVTASEIVESPVHEVNDPRDEVNVMEAKSDTNKNEDERNLNRDESQPVEDGNVSESTENKSMVFKECIMEDIMEVADEVKFVLASEIKCPVNEVTGAKDEINVVEAKLETNKYEGERNPNHDESQPNRIVSESTEIISMESNEDKIMQDDMEVGDEVTKFVYASEIVESPVNEVNGAIDELNVEEAMSETNKNEDQRNLNLDESQPLEDEENEVTKFVPASDLVISPRNDVNGARDEVNVVEGKSDTNKSEDQRNRNHDEFQPVEDENVSESTDIMEVGDEVTKFLPASDVVISPMNEVNGARDEVNVVGAKSDTNDREDGRNLNHDEFQPGEDENVSKSTDIMEVGDEVTKFLPASDVVISPMNEVNGARDEVNVVGAKSDTNDREDGRNLNHNEFQHVEDENVSESSKIISMDIMEVGDEVTKFVPASDIVISPMNEVNGAADEVNVVEEKSDTNNSEDQRNLNHDESQCVKDVNVPESTEFINMVSNERIITLDIMEVGNEATKFVLASEIVESPVNEINVVETKSDTNKNKDQRNLNHDEFQDENVSESTDIIDMVFNKCVVMQDIVDVGDEVTVLVPTSEIVEPCQTHYVAEDGLVSEKVVELPTSLDGKFEYDNSNLVADDYGVVLYNSNKSSSVSEERAVVMPDMMEVEHDEVGGVVRGVVSASEIVEAHSVAEEDTLVSANTLVQQETTTLQPQDGNDNIKTITFTSSAEKNDLTAKEDGKTVTSESPRAEELLDEQIVNGERPKRRVSEPKYLKDYLRFK